MLTGNNTNGTIKFCVNKTNQLLKKQALYPRSPCLPPFIYSDGCLRIRSSNGGHHLSHPHPSPCHFLPSLLVRNHPNAGHTRMVLGQCRHQDFTTHVRCGLWHICRTSTGTKLVPPVLSPIGSGFQSPFGPEYNIGWWGLTLR